MAYLALYRVWRPQNFKEVVGQEQTVKALRNAVTEGKVAHAYLFSGPRGTGKTSVAKIIAKAVNCINVSEGEPCNTCNSCNDINRGNFMDVIEIDAASNRGIDEIRDLREKVRIMPAQGNKKVYIIDEVHMLTNEAFNALLKTIEEPPDSVMFILATTELQKIPATIISRCQTYKFRRITGAEIISRLEHIALTSGIEISSDAVALIARRSNGGLRDALSILDQVCSFKGMTINKEDVLEVLGLVDEEFLYELVNAMLSADMARIIEMLNIALEQGKEAQQIARECVSYLRDLLLYIIIGEQADILAANKVNIKALLDQSSGISQERLLLALRKMMDTADRLRISEGNRFQLEIAFLETAAIITGNNKEGILKDTEPAVAEDIKDKVNKSQARNAIWKQILARVKEKRIPTHALLMQGNLLGIKNNRVLIGFKKGYKFHKERMEEPVNRETVESVLKDIFKQDLSIEFIFIEDEQYNDIVVKKAIEIFGQDFIEIKD